MIAIIGSGPVGSYLAYLLKDKEVCIFEEHSKIGSPVQCTGVVSNYLSKIIDVKDFIKNNISKVRFIEDNDLLELNIKKEFIIDREKFDKYLAKLAVKNGAKLFLKHKFLGYNQIGDKYEIFFENGKKYIADILIGADGVNSKVAEAAGLWKNDFLIGMQARVKMDKEENVYEIYPTNNFFGWSVPEGNGIFRIGYAGNKNIKENFNKLLKKFNVKKVIEYQSGLIPVYRKRRISNGNVFLVGDAAGQVKNSTGGGIITGLLAARKLAEAILENKNYEYLLKDINKELDYHARIRNILDKFSSQDYIELFKLLNHTKIKKIFNEMDRDFPKSFIFKLLLNEPRLLKFAVKLF